MRLNMLVIHFKQLKYRDFTILLLFSLLLFIGIHSLIWKLLKLKKFTMRDSGDLMIRNNAGFIIDLSDNLLEKDNQNLTCAPPNLELWPDDITKLFKYNFTLQCSTVESNWITVLNGKYIINKTIIQKHKGVTCWAWPIHRDGDFKIKLGEKQIINDEMPIISDFSEIRCKGNTGKIYHNLVSGIKPINTFTNIANKTNIQNDDDKLNIIIIGLDSMSRLHWKRTLPHTYDYFTKDLNGFVLEGYNTLGGGTTAALLPLLTGLTENEIPESRRGFKGAQQIDHLPWIWNTLKDMGYVTMWGEDGAASGTFQLRLMGFKNPPVSHYMRPFYLRAEHSYKKHKPYCLGSVPRHVNMLNWMKQFVKTYPNHPKFGFIFHSEYSHHGNYEVQLMDKDIVEILQQMKDSNFLNKTVLLLMSDHGARFQDLRRTKQGSLEEQLPFFGLKFPDWFKLKYPSYFINVKKNTKRLLFPVDIHKTLLHTLFRDKYHQNSYTKGQSLFYPIPLNRTCMDVDISQHRCACIKWTDISKSDKTITFAGNVVIDKINSITQKLRNYCSVIKLNKIITAKKAKQDSRTNQYVYKLVISVLPSGGHYEAIVEMSSDNDFIVNKSDITRINKYGDQPECIANRLPHLRPYCYCIK